MFKNLSTFSRVLLLTICCLAFICQCPGIALAKESEDDRLSTTPQTVEELISEAEALMLADRPIDARAKLTAALRLAPNDYRPHMMLGQYYLTTVAHFKLAYRYLKTAEKLFEKAHHSNTTDSLDSTYDQQHAMLLFLLSEAQLSLDLYTEALLSLERFQNHYWMDWLPGTKAWILMKLGRINEAIKIAQAGLLRNADPRRTWNILGILLSVKGSRELSLQAFANSIRAEFTLGGTGQIATPLNNAGEVYRELFRDELAESAWSMAVRLPDGCEHILPSLNLSILYVDQLRLFQAERSLKDFETCFAEESLRQDTEHRTLLALARGRIALHSNQLENALELLTTANEDQQWFGRIGTNANDVHFASTVAMAQALSASSAALKDEAVVSYLKRIKNLLSSAALRLRARWLNRQARRFALDELRDFEDLWIRHTDTMIEYPTLGSVLSGFDKHTFKKRITRMLTNDSRTGAHPYYKLYLAQNLLANGKASDALPLLQEAWNGWRPIDRLAKAETKAALVFARKAQAWFGNLSHKAKLQIDKEIEEVFSILPAHVRSKDLSLPVSLSLQAFSPQSIEHAKELKRELLRSRFHEAIKDARYSPKYSLVIQVASLQEQSEGSNAILQLASSDGTLSASVSGPVGSDEQRVALINQFIAEAFSHKEDAPGVDTPPLPILKGVLTK